MPLSDSSRVGLLPCSNWSTHCSHESLGGRRVSEAFDSEMESIAISNKITNSRRATHTNESIAGQKAVFKINANGTRRDMSLFLS